MREVTRTGVSAIPDPTVRSAVSTIGSIGALVSGFSCGIGSVPYVVEWVGNKKRWCAYMVLKYVPV